MREQHYIVELLRSGQIHASVDVYAYDEMEAILIAQRLFEESGYDISYYTFKAKIVPVLN